MTSVTAVAPLATEQWGLVTTSQAAAVGVSAQDLARMANRGEVERVAHGVYRLAGSPEDQFERLKVAWLRLDAKRSLFQRQQDSPPDVVSHRSAAQVHGLGDLDADHAQISVPRRRQTRDDDVQLIRRCVALRDWQLVDGLPVTTPERTVADLAADATDGGHLAGVVRDTLDRGLADEASVAEALAPYAHRYGARAGDGRAAVDLLLVEAGRPGTETALAALSRLSDAVADQLAPLLLHSVTRTVQARLATNPAGAGLQAASAATALAIRAHPPRPSPTTSRCSAAKEIAALLDSSEMAVAAGEHPSVARLVALLRAATAQAEPE